ncbi:Putative ATPase [Yamadazyma tenuis]|uniref:Uncharacterized protein n=1 Tax=Candida tenuis (strain ATCC 10573 / BCRC 21748 / CBS 615 / JCM 9827 / NBRC 10315 / NRRL Y-1498 / VKM Y-70) TaxID=590646 RepID=G3BAE3_CANTC|nr:uncharacterized protein CANTEDRAFT_94922 [Yamadazyma tenuis ATCC 10573]EGV62041.1 hypothetical protein CANTEDRAFT_94922 [Yamadazyma tenuis ATCC 10573]WEJ93287.1 Putative ATPase [Yamadazyma tenuis]
MTLEDPELQHKASEILNESDNEQDEFNSLPNNAKVERLNNLIKKSQIYSQIIADKILQKQIQQKDNGSPTKKRQKRNGNVLEMLTSKQSSRQPKLVKGTMKPYQLEGLNWLIRLYENGLNGILADEMGLGKTLQCISFISFLIEQGITGPYLIVAPLSTISNWYSELKRFTPSLQVLQYIGTKDSRKIMGFEGFNIVLTSYELSIKDFSKLAKCNWKFLIIDEGHRLKNMDCLLIKILKKLDVANRLLITGTPLQNNLNELWSLLNFILPDIFHDLKLFQQWFNFDEIENIQSVKDEEIKQFIEKNFKKNLIKNLHTILSPFILRRLKKDVLNLPPKKEYLIHIELTDYQKRLYLSALNNDLYNGIFELYKYEYEKFNLSRRDPKKYGKELDDAIKSQLKSLKLQNLVMQLRNICNSPYIYYEPFPVEKNLTKYDSSPRDKEDRFIELLIKNSSKFTIIDQLIDKLEGHKILIFSQFTRTLDLLSDYFRYKGIETCRFDGSTAHVDRDKEIKKFKTTASQVFLLSTRSGGLGINLIDADTVILFDNDWNPQVDIQAIDRSHRIGQDKPVKIFRFLVKNSIEELLIIKNYSKRFLERLVIQIGSKNFDRLADFEVEFSNLVKLSQQFGMSIEGFEFDINNGSGCPLLTEEELDELTDRSDECFKNTGRWDNISVFESVSKLDEQST